jgi:Na+:H+ antiporter, NhaA family
MASRGASEQAPALNLFAKFFKSEVAGSIILLICTVVALVWANSPWSQSYLHLLHTKVGVSWGDSTFAISLQHWINDGLMVVFFFAVGLELKRELLIGHLSSAERAILPIMAALGGMMAPALIYTALNYGRVGARGWAIPTATDIAFSIGVLAILGSRVPTPLKIFLTAAAIADDLGAVVVIALFYTETLRLSAFIVALVLLALLFVATHILGVRRLGVLLLLIVGIWAAVFASGIHATVAGILVAIIVPVRATISSKEFFEAAQRCTGELQDGFSALDAGANPTDAQMESLAELELASRRLQPPGMRLEHYLHPLQAYFVLPLFALANAGIVLDGGLLQAMFTPVGLGVFLGLLIGKPLGFLGFSWLAVRSGWARLPESTTWQQMSGIGCLAGIGFTMSLFVTELAFTSEAHITSAKAAILTGSCVSAIVGYAVLSRVLSTGASAATESRAASGPLARKVEPV